MLLRESLPDDILNEPRRKPLSSLEGPRGEKKTARAASNTTPPSHLTDGGDGAEWPMRLQSEPPLSAGNRSAWSRPCRQQTTPVDQNVLTPDWPGIVNIGGEDIDMAC